MPRRRRTKEGDELTIADLKVGAKLVFGNYGVTGAEAHPITWLKASKECDFISEFVLDWLKFDAAEQNNPNRDNYWHGNADYETSNIIQFLNSYKDDWYDPMHAYDAPPGNVENMADATGDYVNHTGFLYNFSEYELNCLASRIDLPSSANIYGNGMFPKLQVFNRKGFRGKPSVDLIRNKRGVGGLREGSYCEFWLRDSFYPGDSFRVSYVDKAGQKCYMYASLAMGLRPICKIDKNARVEQLPDGSGYRIVPFETENIRVRSSKVCTDDEFLELMGLL